MKIHLTIEFNKPQWLARLFPCKHEVGIFEELHDRYSSWGSYLICKKCGREAMDIERNCKHKEDIYGVCAYCKSRISKLDCKHDWQQEPDTTDFFCDICGEYKDEIWCVDN